MATYKVIQDIEAEDKLIGPLSFRQFVYAGVCALCLYLSFLLGVKGAWFVAVILAPVTLLSGFFAFPWGQDQPTEVWALAKIRFMLKPRRRIWSQSGVKELVTVTAPKRIEVDYTKGLSETEVKSRLKVLANTIDSRGWAVKNVNVNLYTQPSSFARNEQDSDRLVAVSSLPQAVSNVDVQPSDDMLDVRSNPIAQQFDSMIAASAKAHRREILDRLQQPAAAEPPQPATGQASGPAQANNQQPAAPNYWFLNQPNRPATSTPTDTVTFNAQVVAPGMAPSSLPVASANPTPDEEALLSKLAPRQEMPINPYGHLHTILPLSAQQQAAAQQNAQAPQPTQLPSVVLPGAPADAGQPGAAPPAGPLPQVTQPPDPAILDLANNDDLNVATLAREAQKRTAPPDDEVVISLH